VKGERLLVFSPISRNGALLGRSKQNEVGQIFPLLVPPVIDGDYLLVFRQINSRGAWL